MMVRSMILTNANTKILQMKCSLCPKYVMLCIPDLYNLKTKRRSEKSNEKLKLTFQNILQIQNCP